MRLTEAHRRLLDLGVATFSTNDAVAVLGVNLSYASKILDRLSESKHVIRLARGRWALPERLQPFALPEALTRPAPSYVSLYSALYHHGLIEQIPAVIYAVTLAATRRITTPLGSVSLHHVTPAFFTGFDTESKNHVKIATPEKALVDVFYLRPARSRLFRALPELELPATFSRRRARSYLKLVGSKSRRVLVAQRLERVLRR